ncbi:TolC family outer membrane protein [Coxiella burnetii]|uniref:Type I secretion outer membrane protein n=1 Tax=Coxiella burnetii (strain Dugway 5J108-111) TaxID=434922 RepID=A9KGW6_COXBN|nr:TolC family outer membrane protein [Coxiella burnetii]ABS77187.1 type I secretion outer membrane protein [Coxiella burnetii Dugway 5J108-111]ATN86574.1 channel protein TolC [Coxiella burnetii str. Schperling]EDR35261.1 type I secretion outer membrane protein, TolC family [Coxiella burnetii Q321]OYK79509.1 channel protein TolC [Coxiella burnetii]OYK81590.1 channel protein TolC [Coxiella burnetii]
MKKKFLVFVLILFSLVAAPLLYAEDLVQVYCQALASDPTFQKAHADWLSARQNLPIAMSGTGTPGSGLFPYVDITAGLDRTFQRIEAGSSSVSGYFNQHNYQVTVTQPIFNYATWKAISSASFSVKAATATYIEAAQDLIFRTAKAYFDVLDAYDQLQFTLAQKESFYHQLVTAQEKFKVGLIAITGVYDAQASYDQAIAQEIQDRNNLDNQLENLRAITGQEYRSLASLKKSIPLVIPHPRNIDAWTAVAERQSFAIQSALYTMLAQRETVKETAAQRYPTLTGTFSYGAQQRGFPPSLSGPPTTGEFLDTTTTTATAGLNLNFPVFQGGFVTHSTRQEEYNYLSASDQLNFTHRDVVRQTRQAYLGVDSGISKIRADRQAIISAQNKLEATQAGYVVGTRTMVDVLDAVTSLYQAQQQWATDRYSYIINIITLKQQAGTLCPHDLAQINTWLGKAVRFDVEKPVNAKVFTPSTTLPHTVKHVHSPKGVQRATRSHRPLIKASRHHTSPVHSASHIETVHAHYAIQLFASRTLAEATAFKNKHRLHDLRIIHQNGWYKVLSGHYSTRQAATIALHRLPSSLQKLKPWVVRVPKVQSTSIKPLSLQKKATHLPPPR